MLHKKYAWLLLVMVICFAGGYYSRPNEVITKIKTVTKTKVIEVIKKDVEIIEKKDGTKITRIKYRKDVFKRTDQKKVNLKIVKNDKPRYSLGVGGLTSLTHVQGTVRVFGNVHIGGYVSGTPKDYNVGALLRIEF